jgi:hypothetical protein
MDWVDLEFCAQIAEASLRTPRWRDTLSQIYVFAGFFEGSDESLGQLPRTRRESTEAGYPDPQRYP